MGLNERTRLAPLASAALLAALAPLPASPRSDTVDASATTLLLLRDQLRQETAVTIAPVYELLTISARNVTNPVADDLQLVLSGWGALSLGSNYVWYLETPPSSRVFADLDLAYAQGELLKRALQLRVGRQLVAVGPSGALQLDGADAVARLPLGFGLSAFVGSPVSQRFTTPRGTDTTYNAVRGTIAFGGRASWVLPRWGEVGFSAVDVTDHGDPSRQQLSGDLRLTPWRSLVLLTNATYDLYEQRWAEANASARYQLTGRLLAYADYRHVDPDLLLSRNSIMAIFAVDTRNEVGGGVDFGAWTTLTIGADYHYLMEPLDGSGHRVNGRATWRPSKDFTLGGELGFQGMSGSPSGTYLDNGYWLARVFASKQLDRFTGTLDVQEYAFQHVVNGERHSLIGSGTLACGLGGGFSALVSALVGTTPYFESRFDVLAKLTYQQTYAAREGR
jgi:hypothetical protein